MKIIIKALGLSWKTNIQLDIICIVFCTWNDVIAFLKRWNVIDGLIFTSFTLFPQFFRIANHVKWNYILWCAFVSLKIVMFGMHFTFLSSKISIISIPQFQTQIKKWKVSVYNTHMVPSLMSRSMGWNLSWCWNL